jgi:predicted membrane protein
MLQKVGLGLIGAAVIVALIYFFKWFFITPFIALGFRVAIAVAIVGILVLLASVIWERYRASKKEKEKEEFKEVKY